MANNELIRKLADGIKEHLSLESVEQQMQLHRAQLKRDGTPRVFDALKKELQERTRSLRDELGPDAAGLKLSEHPNSIRIDNEKRPFVKANLSVPNYSGDFELYYNSGRAFAPFT